MWVFIYVSFYLLTIMLFRSELTRITKNNLLQSPLNLCCRDQLHELFTEWINRARMDDCEGVDFATPFAERARNILRLAPHTVNYVLFAQLFLSMFLQAKVIAIKYSFVVFVFRFDLSIFQNYPETSGVGELADRMKR